jgi:hypothetical protein
MRPAQNEICFIKIASSAVRAHRARWTVEAPPMFYTQDVANIFEVVIAQSMYQSLNK